MGLNIGAWKGAAGKECIFSRIVGLILRLIGDFLCGARNERHDLSLSYRLGYGGQVPEAGTN